MDWIVEHYRDSKGNEPAADFINSLPDKAKARVLRIIKLLKEYGVLLKEPYTKQIKDSQGNIRILYFTYTGRRFILLHGFIKKTDKAPEREIETAEKRMNDFIQRGGRA